MSASYQKRIRGHIDLEWADFFSSLEIRHQPDGTTYLTSAFADQSELQGVLDRFHSLVLVFFWGVWRLPLLFIEGITQLLRYPLSISELNRLLGHF